MAAVAPSTASPVPPSPSPPPTAPMSSTELRAAFSFLPHIHALLTSLQYSTDPSQQTAAALTSFTSRLTACHQLLSSLPAVNVSSAEQAVEYDRLCAVRDRKRELLSRYRIGGQAEDGGQRKQQAGGEAESGTGQKQEEAAGQDATRAMELGT